jgi:hypothetical protein
VQLHPADAERVLRVLIWAGDKPSSDIVMLSLSLLISAPFGVAILL